MVVVVVVALVALMFCVVFFMPDWLEGGGVGIGFDWRGRRGISPPPAPPPPPPPRRPERRPTLSAEARAEMRRQVARMPPGTIVLETFDDVQRQFDRIQAAIDRTETASADRGARPRDPRTGRFISQREVERRRREGIFIRSLEPGSNLVSYDGGVTWERAPAEMAVPTLDFAENPYLAHGGRMPTPRHTHARGGPWPDVSGWRNRHPPTPEVRLRHKDETGELWVFRFPGWLEDLVFVLVENSTQEPDGSRAKHWLRVRPTVWTAREAVASTFGLTAAQYAPVRET